MVSPLDPWFSVSTMAPANLTSRQAVKDFTSQLTALQTSRSAIKALGGKEKPKARKGFLATLFDPRKSPLFAPARFVSAGVADIAGLAQDTELSSYNPLESALRSAKGEFAVTGGEIFPTIPGEDSLARAAKLGGAFAWDVLTDPLNYVGGAGVFSRKGILKATLGDDQLRRNLVAKFEKTASAKLAPERVSTILDELAAQSREVAGPRSRYAVLKSKQIVDTSTGQVIDKSVRDGLAAKTMANVIADGFTRRGRSGVVKALAKEFGDEEVALQLFKSLDQEMVGGLFLKNPITGKPIKRIAGGNAAANPVADVFNQVRFRASAGFAGDFASRNASGRFGPTWAAYKTGLIKANADRLSVGRTLFTDFADTQAQARELKQRFSFYMSKLHATQSTILRIRKTLTKEEQQIFDKQVRYFYHNLADEIDEVPTVTAKARAAAEEVRASIDESFQEFGELTLKLGYQPGFVPLMYSDEYLEYLGKVAPKQGPETRGRYRGNLRRVAFEAPPSAEELAQLPLEGQVAQFLTPMQANRILNAQNYKGLGDVQVFETDPLKILERYTEWAARTVVAERFVQGLKAAGIALYIPPDLTKVVNLWNASFYASALRKVGDEGARGLKETLQRLKTQLEEQVSEVTVAAREAERAGLVQDAQRAYDAANERLVDAVRRQRELDYELLTLESNIEGMYDSVSKDVAKVGRIESGLVPLQALLEDARSAVRNARRRLERAKNNASVSSRIKELTEAQGRGEPVYVWDPAQNQLVDVQAKPATREEIRAARRAAKEDVLKVKQLEDEIDSELENITELRNGVNSLADTAVNIQNVAEADFLYTVRRYAEIMVEKYKLSEAVVADIKPARRVAKDNLELLSRDIALPRAEALRTATMVFVELRQRYLLAVAKVEDKVAIAAAKDAMNDAYKTLQGLLSDVNPYRTKQSTANRRYLMTIKELAERVSSTEVQVALTIADNAKMAQLMDALNDPSITHDVRMNVIGDLQAIYRRIRESGVTDEMLRTLNNDERAIFEANKIYESVPEVYTAKRATIVADLKAAESAVEPDEALIKKLRKQLDDIDALTEEDGLRLIGANRVKVPASLEHLYAPMGVRSYLERLYQLENNLSEWESFIGRVYDPLALVWKTAATVGRGPSYTITNQIGALVNNWLGGVTAENYAKAGKILWAFDKGMKAAEKADPGLSTFAAQKKAMDVVKAELGTLKIGDKTAVEVFEDFLMSGVWLTTDVMAQAAQLRRAGLLTDPFILNEKPGIVYEAPELGYGQVRGKAETALHRGVNVLLTWRGQRFMNELNQNVETFNRLAAFISGYERFNSKYSAVDNVMLLHFDYQDLSDAEQWLKRIVPFYTWTRNNIPLQLRAAFLQQDKIRKLVVLNENIKEYFGADGNDSWISEVLPDYVDVAGGFASRFTFGGNHLALFPKTPIQDVDKLFGTAYVLGVPIPVPRLRETAQMLGPAVTPLEFITNTNFDTGQQFTDTAAKINQLGRSLMPYVGTAQRISSAATVPLTLAGADLSGVPFVRADKGMSNLYGFLIGAPYGAATITEKSLLGGMISKSKANSAQLRELAADAGVDVQWLRKEIRKGTSLADLRLKIALGEGNVKKMEVDEYLATIQGKSTDKPDRDYAKTLAAFRAGHYGGF